MNIIYRTRRPKSAFVTEPAPLVGITIQSFSLQGEALHVNLGGGNEQDVRVDLLIIDGFILYDENGFFKPPRKPSMMERAKKAVTDLM
jgi:hypothetical protein